MTAILYAGTLPPHEGGSAIMAGQLLPGLAAVGHPVHAIAPISEAALAAGDPYGGDFEVERFTMPFHETSPDNPAGPDYRAREAAEVQRLVSRAIARERPDVLVIGRESFAPHVVDLARGHALPTMLLVAGATTQGIVNGSYPAEQARSLVDRLRQIDALVVSAEHMREALAGLGLTCAHVIPNPVDVERFAHRTGVEEVRRSLGVGEDDVLVSHLSNLKPIKRPLDVVHAAEIALRSDQRLVFAVVGDGLCRAETDEECARLGLSERFRFTGWLPYDEIPAYVGASDIVVMPSAGEAQALVYLETQAAGRTLVASDIPAAREVVEDGRTGLLFPVGDEAALAAAIVRAAGDPDLRERIGREARRDVARHALPTVVDAYSAAIDALA